MELARTAGFVPFSVIVGLVRTYSITLLERRMEGKNKNGAYEVYISRGL